MVGMPALTRENWQAGRGRGGVGTGAGRGRGRCKQG